MNCAWRLLTPHPGGAPGGRGAIACFELTGNIREAARVLELGELDVGSVRLRELGGLDIGVVARPAADRLLLFPHGGPAIVRGITEWLAAAGATHLAETPLRGIEARVSATLARAASPLAIDLLLDQPRRWAREPDPARPALDQRSACLDRLVHPPLVVAIGPPNVGKSSLLNALAGRGVSLVANVPGATRDHVGAMLELDGLVVRYLDTPGMVGARCGTAARPAVVAEIDESARELAVAAAAGADLLLLCSDATHEEIAPPAPLGGIDAVRVGLRADLGSSRSVVDLSVSVIDPETAGRDIPRLARLIRDRLVPDAALRDPGPWRFWDYLGQESAERAG